jgi:cytochrome c biogenesis protein CcmG/thiol:disulfide interchange protein DsbE
VAALHLKPACTDESALSRQRPETLQLKTLVHLSRSGKVEIVGLNWKDERDKAQVWLRQLGDPYSINIFDKKGRTAIDLGVYGAPETFLVDSKGIIHYKHAGPVTMQLFNETLLPLIEDLKRKG